MLLFLRVEHLRYPLQKVEKIPYLEEGDSKEEPQISPYIAEEISEGELDILLYLVDLVWCIDGDAREDIIRMLYFPQRIALHWAKPGH